MAGASVHQVVLFGFDQKAFPFQAGVATHLVTAQTRPRHPIGTTGEP